MDGAREWVEGYAASRPALAEALQDGAVQRVAAHTTLLWRRACDARIGELRRSDGVRKLMNRSHVHRTVTAVTRAFTMKHGTFAVFLSEPMDGLQRWQSACSWHTCVHACGGALSCPGPRSRVL